MWLVKLSWFSAWIIVFGSFFDYRSEASNPPMSSTRVSECTPLESYKAAMAIENQVFEWAKREFGIRAPEDLPLDCDLLLWKDVHSEHNSMREPEIIGRKSFKCKKCSKTFKSWEYLDRHIEERHQPGKERQLKDQQQSTCIGRFCSFIPCGDIPTVISSLPPRHPERTRSALLCKETFSKCFPPSKSKSFSSAHEAMQSFFCEGKTTETLSRRGSSSLPPTSSFHDARGGDTSMKTVLSWMVLVIVIIYYLYTFLAGDKESTARPKGLGYTPPSQTYQTQPVNRMKRKQVQGTFDLGTSPTVAKDFSAPLSSPTMDRSSTTAGADDKIGKSYGV